jgi:hypothetical protein
LARSLAGNRAIARDAAKLISWLALPQLACSRCDIYSASILTDLHPMQLR